MNIVSIGSAHKVKAVTAGPDCIFSHASVARHAMSAPVNALMLYFAIFAIL